MNNDEFTLKGTLKTGTSQKGNEYTYLELRLNKDYSLPYQVNNQSNQNIQLYHFHV